MSNLYDQRKVQCEEVLRRLLTAPRTPLDPALVPTAHGLYAIARKGRPDHEFLHVGISETAKDGLRNRICEQHLGQNGHSDLLQRVRKTFPKLDRKAARKWIDENCTVQWVEEPDRAVRAASEHYALAILRPAWLAN